MAKKPHEQRQRAKPSLLMRLVAGIWFVIAFLIPAFLYFNHETSQFSPRWSAEFVLAVILPAAITGLFGSLFGARILLSDNTNLRAIVRGFGIAFVSYPLILALTAGYRSFNSYNPFSEFAWVFVYTFLISAAVILPVMMIIGAVAGLLLSSFRRMFTIRI